MDSQKTQYPSQVLPASGNLLNFVALCFHLVPKNLLSWVTGLVVRLELPKPLATGLCRLFARTFRLNLVEAERPLEDYRSIEDLFTRRLKPGQRTPVAPLGSPADGYLAWSAPAPSGEAVQAKGLTYSLAELVFGPRPGREATPDFAWYQTIYLAPHNYHRVHAPVGGRVERVRYLPGQLWPVNVPFVLRIPRLFSRNERLVFDFVLPGGGRVWAVMVGAFNVGRMETPLAPDLVTNTFQRQTSPQAVTREVGRELALGDEIGTFMLGSTVILVYDRLALESLGGAHQMLRAEGNQPILMGQTLLRGDA